MSRGLIALQEIGEAPVVLSVDFLSGHDFRSKMLG